MNGQHFKNLIGFIIYALKLQSFITNNFLDVINKSTQRHQRW